MSIVDSEDLVTCPYCGPKNLKLTPTYTLFKDGDFVFMRPHDPLLLPVWLGRTQNDVVKDDQNELFKIVRMQLWVPMKKRSNLDECHLYENC
jgi:hypothetical protein